LTLRTLIFSQTRASRLALGAPHSSFLPVRFDRCTPNVYPRKSNVSAGTSHTCVLLSFTVSFSPDIMRRIASAAF
jgi:hypothetical protein